MPFDKSFFYTVTWRDAPLIVRKLDTAKLPYSLKSLPWGEIGIVFPDVNVRQYSKVRSIFGYDGEPYLY
ncbi:hypothetical protein ACQCN2_08075 [Brevibacillus ginsengisoli]|uniref:hypothetical protein n=1 Tax=Brevibacillus ginsengisoli TaxID=363854 RepID=UPI003CEA244E